MGKALDLTNQHFGKLTALYKTGEKTKSGLLLWTCQCDCGKIIQVAGSSLKNGNTKSCGCLNPIIQKNLQQSEQSKIQNGTRFGKLTVIKDLGLRQYTEGHSRRWYLCQCDCGNTKETTGNQLKTNHIISCGQCNCSSKGEEKIKLLLEQHKICYQHDVVFPQLYNETGRRLRFDFIVYDINNNPSYFIEFDGRQHYVGPDTTCWSRTTETLETIQEKDLIKNNFCISHNYILLRIPYYEIDNISIETLFDERYRVR